MAEHTTLDLGSGWSLEQDHILLGAHITDSVTRAEMKRRLPSKTLEQCQQRLAYYREQTGNKGTWTRHEDQILQVCQKFYGNRWKSIKNFLPGRSENAVKNRWTAITKKTMASEEAASAADFGDFRSRKMQQHQAQLRQLATQPGGVSRADMHLRLSPGAFGMHSDSPAPHHDTAWGNTSNVSNNNSFSFYATSPEATPSKQRMTLSQPGGVQPPQPQMGIGGPNSSPGGFSGGRNSHTPLSLKIDTNAPFAYGGSNDRSKLDESTSSMSREDMSELAEAFVAQEVEKFRKQTGETMSQEDQMLIRKAFVAGMQHTPHDKEMTSDLQWEFDQSGSIDAMISMEEEPSHFDGVVTGQAIFSQSAKSPDNKFSRSGLVGMSMNSSIGGPRHHGADLSIEGHSWGGPLHSDLLTTDNLDEMSMSLLHMSIDESQDQVQPNQGGFRS